MVHCINGEVIRIIHRSLNYSFSNRSEDDKAIVNGEYFKEGETVVVEIV